MVSVDVKPKVSFLGLKHQLTNQVLFPLRPSLVLHQGQKPISAQLHECYFATLRHSGYCSSQRLHCVIAAEGYGTYVNEEFFPREKEIVQRRVLTP